MSSAVLPVSFSADFFSQFTYVIIIKYSGILLYHWNHKYCFFFMGLYKFVLVVAVPLHVRIVGEGLMNHSPTNASFFFISRDQLMHTNSTLLIQDQSTVAQQAETIVAECSLMSCV